MIQCHKCLVELDLNIHQSISRAEECPQCGANIRCCLMCIHYDTTRYNECREPISQRITDKEKPNFCDHYRISTEERTAKTSKNDLLAAAEALFKKN